MNSPLTTPQISPYSDSSCKPEACATTAELMTPDQLARRLGISRRCLGNWTRDRLVPMLKIGRVCRFDFAKVSAALERHERAAVVAGADATSPESTRIIKR